jgi:hypothetical protein
LAIASRDRELSAVDVLEKDCFGETPKPTPETGGLPEVFAFSRWDG